MLAPVEHECMLRELDALREAFEELDNLFEFAKSLKNRVAQMIEVLNEANDKSIRTFTAVTVIFLPI
jgi:Mg2+ and Co2+ transporter CorA